MVKPCEHGKWSKFPANDGFWNAMEFPYFSHSSYYVITCPHPWSLQIMLFFIKALELVPFKGDFEVHGGVTHL